MAEKDGGSAFLEVFSTFREGENREPGYLTDVYSAGGMSLRDYFAAAALQGFISGFGLVDLADTTRYDNSARQSYRFADAMLKARSEPQHGGPT